MHLQPIRTAQRGQVEPTSCIACFPPLQSHNMKWGGLRDGKGGGGWGKKKDFSIHFNIAISLAHMLIRFLDPLSVYRAEQGGTRVHLLVLQLLLLLKP